MSSLDLPIVHSQCRLEAVWSALQVLDRDLAEHGERTADVAVRLARHLQQGEQFQMGIRWAARLHDIGKVVLPRAILDKPGPLTEVERQIVRRHPVYSSIILRRTATRAAILQPVLFHHERLDGKGYPSGLKGEQVPLPSRILAVADVYSALTSDRPYRGRYSPNEALDLMVPDTHSAFDERVMKALEEVTRQPRC